MKKGSLQVKGNKYYAVTYNKDQYGKLKQKWIPLGLDTTIEKKLVDMKFKEVMDSLPTREEEKVIKNNLINSKPTAEDMPFCDLADIWLDSRKTILAENSFLYYKNYIRMIKEFFADKNLTVKNFTHKEIESFLLNKTENGCIGKTNLYYYHIFRAIFDYAIKAGIIDYNPVDRVIRPKRESNFKPQYYDAKQLRNLLSMLEIEDYYLKVPLSIIITYGLRRSEMVGLMWKSIDFENKEIHIDHKVVELHDGGKSKILTTTEMKTESSKRVLPLIPSIEKMLLEFKNKLEENRKKYPKSYNKKYLDYVCVTDKGRLITPAAVSTGFQRFLSKHNLRQIRLHDLRHSCASMLLANGVPMKAIQDWLGHESFDTTADVYSHIDYQSKKESGDTIQNLIFSDNDKQNDLLNINENVNENNFDEIVSKLLGKINSLEKQLQDKEVKKVD